MDRPHRCGLGGHFIAGQQLRRQGVLQLVRVRQRRMHAAVVSRRGQPLGARIDRHKGACLHLRLGAYQRVQQFAVGHGAADASFKIVALPHCELVGGVGCIEPRKRQHTGIVGCQHTVHHAAALDAAGRLLLQNRRLNAAFHIVGGVLHRIRLRVVDVFAGVAQKQVAYGRNAQLFKLFGKGRAYPF